MKLTEDQLKQILQRQTARSTTRQAHCLTEDQFIRVATGAMNKDERFEAARHMATCTDCAEEYRVIRSLKPWAGEAAGVLAPSMPPDRRTLPGRLRDSVAAFGQRLVWEPNVRAIGAFALVIIMAGGSLLIWQSTTTQREHSSGERSQVSFRLSVEPADGSSLSQVPEKLSWSPIERTITYRVVLYDFQSTPIWESARLRETSVELPDAVRRKLVGGQRYYWRVIAEDAIEQRQSELFQFTLTGNESR